MEVFVSVLLESVAVIFELQVFSVLGNYVFEVEFLPDFSFGSEDCSAPDGLVEIYFLVYF